MLSFNYQGPYYLTVKYVQVPDLKKRKKMKIDLKKLGLNSNATFDEIQNKLNEVEFYDGEELKTKVDSAAAAARKAATQATEKKISQNGNVLSDEQLNKFNVMMKQMKKQELKNNNILKKLDNEDFDLIVNGEGLLEKEGDDLNNAITEIEKKYAKRFEKLPTPVEEDKNSTNSNNQPNLDFDDF